MPCDFTYENQCFSEGQWPVAGVDEAGRGPLAGPVVAGAVILPREGDFSCFDDSKKLTEKRREAAFERISNGEWADLKWSVGIADVAEIETLNILRATHLAMQRAVEGLSAKPAISLIDGKRAQYFPLPQISIIKGDSLSLSIAAASIVAKVTRDRLMKEAASEYPEYGFEKHKGYGTREHLENLKAHGPCPIHRKTFEPVAQLTLPLEAK
ncbi:MAG: ribonuclease HII [Verrucomicrobiota bacterium]